MVDYGIMILPLGVCAALSPLSDCHVNYKASKLPIMIGVRSLRCLSLNRTQEINPVVYSNHSIKTDVIQSSLFEAEITYINEYGHSDQQ
jgi:hypothetical protein